MDEKKKTCPRCGSTNITKTPAYEVCGSCGLVLEEGLVSEEKEWRAFDIEQVQEKSRSSTTNELEKEYAQVWDREKGHRTLINFAKGKKLRDIKEQIKRISDKLRLSHDIQRTAKQLISKYLGKKNIRSKKMPAIVSAALYIAARQTGRPKPIDKFVKKTHIEKQEISKGYRRIREVLALKVNPPKPESYAVSFAQDLSLSGRCIEWAQKLIKKAREHRLVLGKDPSGLAAAAIYLASEITNEKRDHKKIAKTAAITKIMVVSRYRELKKELGKFIDKAKTTTTI